MIKIKAMTAIFLNVRSVLRKSMKLLPAQRKSADNA